MPGGSEVSPLSTGSLRRAPRPQAHPTPRHTRRKATPDSTLPLPQKSPQGQLPAPPAAPSGTEFSQRAEQGEKKMEKERAPGARGPRSAAFTSAAGEAPPPPAAGPAEAPLPGGRGGVRGEQGDAHSAPRPHCACSIAPPSAGRCEGNGEGRKRGDVSDSLLSGLPTGLGRGHSPAAF